MPRFRDCILLGFLILAIGLVLDYANMGQEKADLILMLDGRTIPPNLARHVDIVYWQGDVAINIEQFTVLEAE